jgi:hypothetical protein
MEISLGTSAVDGTINVNYEEADVRVCAVFISFRIGPVADSGEIASYISKKVVEKKLCMPALPCVLTDMLPHHQ